jgi:hypothetical protein
MDTATMVYLCVFAAGFVFLLVSFLCGIENIGADHHLDISHCDSDGQDYTINPSFFSAKVIACFLVGVGMGAIVSHSWLTPGIKIYGLGYFIDMVTGLVAGLILGHGGWWIVKFFLSQQASSVFSNDKFIGVKVPLRVGMPKHGTGEISAELDGQIRSLNVRSEDGRPIISGTEVEVVRISGSVGIVSVCK